MQRAETAAQEHPDSSRTRKPAGKIKSSCKKHSVKQQKISVKTHLACLECMSYFSFLINQGDLFQLRILHNFSKQRKAARVNKRLETRGGGGDIYPDRAY